MNYFENNQLKLNILKSSDLVINLSYNESVILEYKSKQLYLGVIISDCVIIKIDVQTYIKGRKGNTIVKFPSSIGHQSKCARYMYSVISMLCHRNLGRCRKKCGDNI